MRQTKQQKIDDRRIDNAYRQHCSGVQINIMDIGKVFAVGQQAIDAGASDPELAKAIVDYVQTIRHN